MGDPGHPGEARRHRRSRGRATSARDWLARLPALVAEVAEQWDLEVGAPLEPGGNISWVAPARRRSDGLDAVLKVQLPHPESAPEAVGLRAWAGDGAVLPATTTTPSGGRC